MTLWGAFAGLHNVTGTTNREAIRFGRGATHLVMVRQWSELAGALPSTQVDDTYIALSCGQPLLPRPRGTSAHRRRCPTRQRRRRRLQRSIENTNPLPPMEARRPWPRARSERSPKHRPSCPPTRRRRCSRLWVRPAHPCPSRPRWPHDFSSGVPSRLQPQLTAQQVPSRGGRS